MVEWTLYFSHKKMKRFPIIAADLFVNENVGTEKQRLNLKEQALYHFEKNDIQMAFSNDGCWRSTFKYENLDWLMGNIKDMVQQAIDYYCTKDPAYQTKVNEFGDAEFNYWTNVNAPGSRNMLHVHSLYHYVGVYYIQTENTGDLIFHNHANLLQESNPHSPFISRMAYKPKDGDLVLWPGWMPHETEINHSKNYRINIPFNIRFQTPFYIKP